MLIETLPKTNSDRASANLTPRAFATAYKIDSGVDAYLDLLKKCLTRYIFPDPYAPLRRPSRTRHPLAWAIYPPVSAVLRKFGYWAYRYIGYHAPDRALGTDWPGEADTMIGLKRLDNIQFCIEQILNDDVSGDLIETGVWRGGACIFMRAVLKAYGANDRKVWLADSFQGLPRPDGRFDQDQGDRHWEFSDYLGVSVDQVKANFSRYNLLDDQVCFLKGWFKDTLPNAPIERLSLLRLDGDMYASTMDAITSLYPKLSVGGFVVVDDYGNVAGCQQAIDDYRQANGIRTPIEAIDGRGVFWRKTSN